MNEPKVEKIVSTITVHLVSGACVQVTMDADMLELSDIIYFRNGFIVARFKRDAILGMTLNSTTADEKVNGL